MNGGSMGWRGPERWIAAIPLLLIPCCWLWWWVGGLNPGLETGRSAALLLLIGAGLAAWRLRTADALPRPALPLLLALAWMAASLLWAPVREPGLVWLAERAAAAAAAVGLALWSLGRPAAATAAAAAIAGLGVLALTCLTQYGDIGALLRTNREAPFGNVNFGIGAALPLVAVGLARFLHGGGGRWWLFALAAGACVGLLAGGALGGDPCRAAWLGGAVAVAVALALRLPSRLHGATLLAGGAMLLALWLAAASGVFDVTGLGAGSAYRVHLWQAAGEALSGPVAAVGHGTGAVIAVLPEQPAYAAAWLTVPSYAAHAHNEYLQVLLDGGVILAALLAWAGWATIRPLWRQRTDPACAALLVGWCTAGALALVESHLSQPGGLLCLALLAGVSWAAAEQVPAPAPILRLLPPAAGALALALLIGRELAADGGGPVSVEARTYRHLGTAPADDLAALDRLQARMGPLDGLDLRRAKLLGRLGRGAEAEAALAAHLRRLPCDADGLRLAERLRAAGRAGAALVAADGLARSRAATLIATVAPNARNAEAVAALRAALSPAAGGGQAPAR